MSCFNIFTGGGSYKRSYKSSHSSDSSKYSTRYLKLTLQKLQNNQHEDGTQETYHRAWKSFNDFFIKLEHKPQSWEDRIALFVAFLLDNKNPKATIKTYVSGIKSVLRNDGIILDKDSVLLASLLKSCKYVESEVNMRMPIHCRMLRIMMDRVEQHYLRRNQIYLTKLYKAMFVTAYYGLFRVGEITSSKHVITLDNVHLGCNSNKILFILWSSKMHKRNTEPQTVEIKAIGAKECTLPSDLEKYCPYKIIRAYLELRLDNEDTQFFVYSDDSPVTGDQFRRVMRWVIKDMGLNPLVYDTHSFRIGRATDLQKMGASLVTIKKMGRWRSNSVYKYLK